MNTRSTRKHSGKIEFLHQSIVQSIATKNIQLVLYIYSMSMNASALDLRYHTRELLERVQSGESIVISHHGKDAARLVPVLQAGAQDFTLPAFGMWADHDTVADPSKFVRELRRSRF